MLYPVIFFLFATGCGIEKDSASLKSQAKKPSKKQVVDALADIEHPEVLAYATGKSVNALVSHALLELHNAGHHEVAARRQKQFMDKYRYYFASEELLTKDIGDHEPWRQWLVEFYDDLEALLGTWLCEKLHFDDIKIINYAVPVAFNPTDSRWDEAEYVKHYVPLIGSLTYWAVYATCSMVTYGGDIMWVVCSPVGSAAERLIVKRRAPQAGVRLYRRANGIDIY